MLGVDWDWEGDIGESTFLIGLWDAMILRGDLEVAEVSPSAPRVLHFLYGIPYLDGMPETGQPGSLLPGTGCRTGCRTVALLLQALRLRPPRCQCGRRMRPSFIRCKLHEIRLLMESAAFKTL